MKILLRQLNTCQSNNIYIIYKGKCLLKSLSVAINYEDPGTYTVLKVTSLHETEQILQLESYLLSREVNCCFLVSYTEVTLKITNKTKFCLNFVEP